ncbi:ScbA/BarX family gamma-butyrolactone biosynthesis protein [Streptomyces sp. NPDC005791]|uniref:ScbA/BarX family gamma-butyrolactone biosynthesis protein n=1 Tax=Streptomyces sp. NPDC005791 TaxID=3364732 RepID=UPI00369E9380
MPNSLLAAHHSDLHDIRSSTPTSPPPGDTLKRYVHLRHEDSVLVTGWSARGGHHYEVTVSWPVLAEGTAYDPRLLTQTIRQSCLVIAHAERGVPLSHQTLMERMDVSVVPEHLAPRGGTTNLSVELECDSTGRRSMRTKQTVLHDHNVVAESLVDFSWIAPSVYRRLRGEQLDAPWGETPVRPPVAPSTVGRADSSDVVLAPTDRRHHWELRVDVRNTALYDHPVDHVPGLVLIEASYQAAHAVSGPLAPQPRTLTSSFDRYIDFGRPCWIDASAISTTGDGRTVVEVVGVQDGERAFRVTLV